MDKFIKYFTRIGLVIGVLLILTSLIIYKTYNLELYCISYNPICYNCVSEALENNKLSTLLSNEIDYKVNGKYCSHCGKADYGVVVKRVCSKCDKVYDTKSSKYCSKCGGKITDSSIIRLNEDNISLSIIRLYKVTQVMGLLFLVASFILYYIRWSSKISLLERRY